MAGRYLKKARVTLLNKIPDLNNGLNYFTVNNAQQKITAVKQKCYSIYNIQTNFTVLD